MPKYQCSAPCRINPDGALYSPMVFEAAGPYEARKMYARYNAIPVFVVVAHAVEGADVLPPSDYCR